MVKLRVPVFIIGMILSPVIPFPPEPEPYDRRRIFEALTEKITLEDTIPLTRRPPVIDDCAFYDKAEYYLPYLRLHSMQKTWLQAKSTCEREGGNLASPRTEQELELYMDYVSHLGQVEKWYWIGVSRHSLRDPWMTVKGDVLHDEKLTDGSWSLPGNPLTETGCWRIIGGFIAYTNCTAEKYRSSFLCERKMC